MYTAQQFQTSPPQASQPGARYPPHNATDSSRMRPQQTTRTQQQPHPANIGNGRMSPSMRGYTSPGAYSPGRMSPSHGPGSKKPRALPQLPPGREPMGKRVKWP